MGIGSCRSLDVIRPGGGPLSEAVIASQLVPTDRSNGELVEWVTQRRSELRPVAELLAS